jgi:hypothetical protein
MTFAARALRFFKSLDFPAALPKSVELMNPYRDAATFGYVTAFFDKFYSDDAERVSLWGINPGRHGGGLTGLAFTDPIALKEYLGIEHSLTGRREPSSMFIYNVIERFGGAEKFYGRFYINSLSPLGFTRLGRNYNFYDDAQLLTVAMPFIVSSMRAQLKFGVRRHVAICLGTGKLYDVFTDINHTEGFFKKIIPVEHPRFVMQYRRKRQAEFVEKYLDTLSRALT